jgi:hypothetical protein
MFSESLGRIAIGAITTVALSLLSPSTVKSKHGPEHGTTAIGGVTTFSDMQLTPLIRKFRNRGSFLTIWTFIGNNHNI